MSGARDTLLDLYRAAVAGANPESMAASAVAALPLERGHRVWVFSIGKAAHSMAAGAVAAAQRSLADVAGGVVVAPDEGPPPYGTVDVVAGDHPVPGARSSEAAGRIQDAVTRKRGTDLGIVLLSGGASSLMAAPLRGLALSDLTASYELLLGAGLDIQRMNAVRKRFSYWAAGRMALGLAPARSHCFALSDVPGDDMTVIGSGPCVPDPLRARDVVDLLQATGLYSAFPQPFRTYLADTMRGLIPETPKATHPAFAHVTATVIGSNAMALGAAALAARRLGLSPQVYSTPLVGDARAAGERIALELLREREIGSGARCLIWGGETTVRLPSRAAPPGGRCQMLALSAAAALAAADGDGDAGDITLLAAGTDGRDGTTDVAGAVVDASTCAAIAASGHDPAAALERYESHDALQAAGALFSTGPTGTNVMDVVIGLIREPARV